MVRREYQKMGLGKCLMSIAEDLARNWSISKCQLTVFKVYLHLQFLCSIMHLLSIFTRRIFSMKSIRFLPANLEWKYPL